MSIATLTGDNGLLTKTNEAKIETAIGTVKEALKLEQSEKIIDNINLTPELLLAEGKATRAVQQGEDSKYYMYYALKENAYKEMKELGKGSLAELKDIFLIDDKLNVRYISKDGKIYGDEIEMKILEDTTPIRFASKTFSEYISNKLGKEEAKMTFELMKNQTSLTIADSSVDTLLDLVFFPNLTSLTLGDYNKNSPQITNLDGIQNCTKLTSIKILYGPDKDYTALVELPNLTYFYRYSGKDYENIIDNLKLCSKIEDVTIIFQQIEDMTRIGELKDLKNLNLSYNKITEIKGLENKLSLSHLNLDNNKITEIKGLENLLNLKTLYLRNNIITDICPLSVNTSLTSLYLIGNTGIDGIRENYTGEKLNQLNKIGQILDRGGAIHLDIDKLGLFTNYRELNLNEQKLTTLKPLKGLTELTTLTLTNNQLTLKDDESREILKSLKNLISLNLSSNKVSNISEINSLSKLKNLYLINNDKFNLKEIEDIISNLNLLTVSTENLKTILDCDKNKITTLNLIESNLTEIPNMSNFNKLTKLSLQANPNISNFNNVSEITSLENLNLSSNNLHDRMINFSNLKNLTYLNLSNNILWDKDLENLKALKDIENLTIDLSNNSIINATALLELNKNTKIILKENVNLTKEAKDKLEQHFKKENVIF